MHYGRPVTARNAALIAMEFDIDPARFVRVVMQADLQNKKIYLNETSTTVEVVQVMTFPRKKVF